MITVDEFLASASTKITYKMIPHQFAQKKGLGKQVCKGCGLVALKNKLTQWAINKGCLNEYHAGHTAAIKRYTRATK